MLTPLTDVVTEMRRLFDGRVIRISTDDRGRQVVSGKMSGHPTSFTNVFGSWVETDSPAARS